MQLLLKAIILSKDKESYITADTVALGVLERGAVTDASGGCGVAPGDTGDGLGLDGGNAPAGGVLFACTKRTKNTPKGGDFDFPSLWTPSLKTTNQGDPGPPIGCTLWGPPQER